MTRTCARPGCDHHLHHSTKGNYCGMHAHGPGCMCQRCCRRRAKEPKIQKRDVTFTTTTLSSVFSRVVTVSVPREPWL